MTATALEVQTVDELAEELRVHPATVRRWIKSGALGALKFGDHIGTIRIPREQVEALLRRVAAGGRSAATQGSRNGPGTVRHSQAPSHS